MARMDIIQKTNHLDKSNVQQTVAENVTNCPTRGGVYAKEKARMHEQNVTSAVQEPVRHLPNSIHNCLSRNLSRDVIFCPTESSICTSILRHLNVHFAVQTKVPNTNRSIEHCAFSPPSTKRTVLKRFKCWEGT